MMLFTALLVGAASFRAWRIIAKDQIAEPIRIWIITRERHRRFWDFIGDLIGCSWCLGFWFAGVGAILAGWHMLSVFQIVLVWLSASAIAGLLGEIDARLTRAPKEAGV